MNIGPGRSGTTSFFEMIIQHPDIHSTGLKEIFTFKDIKSYKQYIELFENIDGIHVDGTPNLYKKRWFVPLIKKLKDDFDRTVFIYIKRDQLEHWKSQISHGFLLGNIPFDDLDRVIYNLKPHEYFIKRLTKIYGNDLLIIDFEKLNDCQEKVYEFLKIDSDFRFDLLKLNSLESLTNLHTEIRTIIEGKMNEKEIVNRLPLFPLTRHGKKLTEDQLEKLIELISNAPKRSYPKRGKCACGGQFEDWHSHASECIVINPNGKDFDCSKYINITE